MVSYSEQDMAYSMTALGYVVSVVILLVVFVFGISMTVDGKNTKLTARQLTFSAI